MVLQVVVLSKSFLGISGENRETFSVRLLLGLTRDQLAARHLLSSRPGMFVGCS